ncbi:MAG: DUF202 domain-containing protein [Candidatus Latescibacteria bacterium]|nr:DUF202 domain-containing protein [Candidatus Latescibacterota bacterium]
MKYDDTASSNLILRDHLALDRTKLANRRTMLAYLRTALMLLVSGATLVKVFHSEMVMIILGITLLSISFVVAVAGLISYQTAKRRMKNLYNLPGRME